MKGFKVLSDPIQLLNQIAGTLVAIVRWFVTTLWWVVRKIGNAILAGIKPALRYLAFLLLVVAVIALVAGLTPVATNDGDSAMMSLGEHWQIISPNSLIAAKQSIAGTMQAWVWQTFETVILNRPTFLVFGVLGLLCAYAGRRRKILDVFVN